MSYQKQQEKMGGVLRQNTKLTTNGKLELKLITRTHIPGEQLPASGKTL